MDDTAATPKATGALAGIGFGIALFLGVAALNVPTDATDSELSTWYAESGNLVSGVVSMFAFFIAGASLLFFVSALARRLRDADASGGQLTSIMSGAGYALAATLFVTGAVRGAVGKAVEFNDQPVPAVGTLRAFNALSSTLLGVMGMLAAAVVIAVASNLVSRDVSLPRWLAYLGYVCAAVLVVAQATFLGELAIPVILIWAIATSVQLLRRRALEAAAHPTQAVSFS
ncbi:MAG: hypothetical protein ABIM89_19090 [Mycobacteriales bacterium]